MTDFVYAARMLRKRPGLALVAVIALALGIGANSAIFSVTNGILLRPFPFPDLDRLVSVRAGDARRSIMTSLTPADYLDIADHNGSFQRVAAWTMHSYDLTGEGGEPEGLRGATVTPNLLATLGVRPALGRDFRPGEDVAGQDQVVILSHALWQRRFGGDPAILDRTILLDSRRFRVIGVMPPDFEYPLSSVLLWAPLALPANARADRRNHYIFADARLRDGVSLRQARAEMTARGQRLEREYPDTNADREIRTVLLREVQMEVGGPFLVLLQAVALFVLLIACANVANLQLAQAAARKREIAIRASLGSGRWRVIRMLLAESLVLALAGGAAGVGVAFWGVHLIRLSVPVETTRNIMGWNQVAVQPPVLLFTLILSVASGVVFGLSAAVQASRVDLATSLKDTDTRGGSRSRLRGALVMAEVLLAVVAVTGASQMVRGFQSMAAVYQGFSPDGVMTFRLALPVERYATLPKASALFDRTLEAVSGIPGVQSATVTSNLPGALRFNVSSEMKIEGRPARSHAEAPLVDIQFVGPGYFEVLHIPIRSGRVIAQQDAENTPLVAVVSATLAARYWPGQNPIHQRIQIDGPWRTVVGVVGDAQQLWFQKESRPLLYLPYRQAPQRFAYVAMRVHGDPSGVLPAARERIRAIDSGLPLHEPKPMTRVMQETMGAMVLTAGLITVFGAIALVLAAVGVYGVMAYWVTQRNREFGIRMALGAQPKSVLGLVLRQGFLLTVWGIGIGLVAAFGLSRAMAGIMYGLRSNSIVVLVGVPALLLVVSLIACWVPARSATQADPVSALRHE